MPSQDSLWCQGHVGRGRQVLRDLPPRRGDRRGVDVETLPYSLKVLLENLLRTEDGANITADDIRGLAPGTRTPSPATRSSSRRPA